MSKRETRKLLCGCVVDIRTLLGSGEKAVFGYSEQCGYASRLFSKVSASEADPRDRYAAIYALKSHGIDD